MDRRSRDSLGSARNQARDSDPHPIQVRPFGPYGAGLFTAHPIGLLVVAAVWFMAWRLPEARWFTVCSVPLGVLVGLVLWLRKRQRTFPSPPSLARKSNYETTKSSSFRAGMRRSGRKGESIGSRTLTAPGAHKETVSQ